MIAQLGQDRFFDGFSRDLQRAAVVAPVAPIAEVITPGFALAAYAFYHQVTRHGRSAPGTMQQTGKQVGGADLAGVLVGRTHLLAGAGFAVRLLDGLHLVPGSAVDDWLAVILDDQVAKDQLANV